LSPFFVGFFVGYTLCRAENGLLCFYLFSWTPAVCFRGSFLYSFLVVRMEQSCRHFILFASSSDFSGVTLVLCLLCQHFPPSCWRHIRAGAVLYSTFLDYHPLFSFIACPPRCFLFSFRSTIGAIIVAVFCYIYYLPFSTPLLSSPSLLYRLLSDHVVVLYITQEPVPTVFL